MRAGSLLRVCAIIVPAFILIACASGGGPGTDSNGNSEAVQIRAPLSRPGFGTGSNPQTATSNSPNFGAGPSPASGTAFPLFENVIAVVPENTAIGDDVRFGSPVTLTTRGGNFELNIPELGIDATLPGDGTTVNVTGGKLTLGIEHRNYLLEGVWAFQSSDPQAIESADFAPFIAGYVTPQTNVPRVGTATYSSAGGVDGIVNVRSGGGVASATLTGDVNFTVNFYADTFTGTLTNVTAVDVNGRGFPWNTVSFSGQLATSTYGRNGITGMTGVNSIPPGLYSLNGSASGYVDGFFYGPSVDEIGAVWSLGNTDNSGAAYGVVAAGRSGGTAPATTRPQFLVQTLPAPDATTSAPPVIGTPVAAAIDTTSHAPVFASVGGPNLSSTGGNFSAAQTFVPLRLTELQFTSTGMSAANDAANADIVLDTNGGLPGNPGIGSVSLIVPPAGVNNFIPINPTTASAGILSAPHNAPGGSSQITIYGLDYTGFGAWLQYGGSNPTNAGYFNFGFETPVASMPTTGSANYSEAGGVAGTAFIRNGNAISEGIVSGDASFTANFATGNVTGTFSHMNSYTTTTSAPWNNVSVSASIAAGSNSFSGSASTTSNPGGTYALKNGATGHIDGGFYGPATNEIGAVWTLSNGDGTGSAIGVVGARKQ